MKHPSQEDLLGYVLGALDAQQHREVQQQIDSNQELEDQLLQIKAALQPLDYIDRPSGPPPGLARRACEHVATFEKTGGRDFELSDNSLTNACPERMPGVGAGMVPVHPESPIAGTRDAESKPDAAFSTGTGLSPATAGSKFSGGWSMADMLVGVAVLAVLAGVLFPAIAYSRYQSRLMSCQSNLQSLGVAMLSYSSRDPDGAFPTIPDSGNLSASGIYAPILKESGLVQNDSTFRCPGLASDSLICIPGREQIENASGTRLVFLRQTMGGDYGYTLGFMDGHQVCHLTNLGRAHVILLSDMPSRCLVGRRSENHNGRGQNLLFEDGRVAFVSGHAWAGDPIFENDLGLVAPGVSESDNVIAPSHLSPGYATRGR